MGRGTKKEEVSASGVQNPEATARKRLKRLAFSSNILSENQAKSSVHLTPSKTVVKHHGKDILKKSQRKNRFLFSLPGLIAPISGGKIGELKDLGTKNPVLYLDFPQGQMKLFGTIVYPKNRYLTLQFSRGGKNVMCEDYFDNMIVFSNAWWIGRKDENPEEARLEIPKELYEGQQTECDFKGGAGASSVVSQNVTKTRIQYVEHDSPETPTEDDLSDSENNKDTKEVVSVRHSERTAGKAYKFAESSGDDSDKSSPVLSEHEEKVVGVNTAAEDHDSIKKKNPYSIVVDIGNDDAAEGSLLPKENKVCASGPKSKNLSQHASVTVTKEFSSNKQGSLVQATISTLFKKVEEKKAPKNQKKSPSSKVTSQKSQRKGSKRKINLVVDDDDIEEISSAENTDGSDEDWAA